MDHNSQQNTLRCAKFVFYSLCTSHFSRFIALGRVLHIGRTLPFINERVFHYRYKMRQTADCRAGLSAQVFPYYSNARAYKHL